MIPRLLPAFAFTVVAVAIAQSPALPEFSAYYRATPTDAPVARYVHASAPLSLSLPDSTGKVTLSVAPIRFHAPGINAITQADGSVDVFLDVGLLSYRSDVVPAGPGRCTIDLGGWSADATGQYFCIANAGGSSVPWVWAWNSPSGYKVSVADPADQNMFSWK